MSHETFIFVVATKPKAFFIPSFGSAIELLIHGPDGVEIASASGIGGIRK
jgi:hypothetical protein